MKTMGIRKIETFQVENFPVYNLELESQDTGDDLFFVCSNVSIISHNCLRKDSLMINEFFPQTDFLLQAYKINEYMPKFIANQMKCIEGADILVLGYTFKKDTDDTRDSLVPKLIRYIAKKAPGAHIMVRDPNLPYGLYTDKFNDLSFMNLELTDKFVDGMKKNPVIVFIATDHSEFVNNPLYTQICSNAAQVIDIWNLGLCVKASVE